MKHPAPRLLAYLLSGIGWLCLSASVWAELPSVRFDRLTPLGGGAGSTVEVEVIGNDLEEVTSLWFDHPGLSAEHVKDKKFKLIIKPEVPAGTYDVRLVGRFGVSNPRLFAVSRGLSELLEKEPNNDPTTAQVVPSNSVVHGSSDSNQEDLYRIALKKGQRIVCECQAEKLDSALDATLSLSSTEGKLLASNGDYHGKDPLLDFVAEADGEVLLSVADLSFRGGHPYRLVLTSLPQVENVFPRAVQVGKTTTLTFFGRNLGEGAKPSTWKIQEQLLDEKQQAFTPEPVTERGEYRFVEHPTNHAVLPTAATCTLVGCQVQLTVGAQKSNAVPVVVSDSPVTLEAEPNDSNESPQKLQLPAVVSARFDKERDADWYEFETEQAGAFGFDVYCERIAGQADPYLVVLDDKGGRVGELDDFGHRTNAFDGHLRDPNGTLTLTAKKKYRVLVQDRYRRGGARYQYVLHIRPPQPDFFVALMHAQNPGPGGMTVRQGGAAYLDVITHHKDGFTGPITLTAEGLPPGLHLEPTIVSDSRSVLVLWADPDAPAWTGTLKVWASAQRGEEKIQRLVRPYARVNADTNFNSSRPQRELVAAIRPSSPFALRFPMQKLEVEAGKKVDVKLLLTRHWPDFKSQVTLQPLALPGPIKSTNVILPAEKNEANLTLDIQANAKPGTYTITVTGQAQVPFNKDPQASSKPNTLVTLPAQPLTLVVLPAVPVKK